MISEFSIIHISDLHRITSDNMGCLLSSFQIEKEKYTAEAIKRPAFIVVSGDIVQGSQNPDSATAQEEIINQYIIASQFLRELAKELLDGDINRVIIVPGNHDVSQYISKESFQDIDGDINELIDKLSDETSLIRWNWNTLTFQKVANKTKYDSRFQDFINFYNSFYENKRIFPEKYDEQSAIYDFEQYNTTFVIFNSCYHLDHLNDSGYISPQSLSIKTKKILEYKRKGRLIIAVWHHHTSGSPKESNYLDNSILDSIAENGIKVVLHGHQHISGIINCYDDVFSTNRIWLISAGTLYGNKTDIVTGYTRQYNAINVTFDGSKYNLELRSRVDNTLLKPTPIWSASVIGKSKDFSFPIEIVPDIIPNHLDNTNNTINDIMIEVEKSTDFKYGIQRLLQLNLANNQVRSVLLDYVERENDYQTLLKVFISPVSVKEVYIVLDYIEKNKDKEALVKLLQSDFIRNTEDHILESKIDTIKKYLKLK